MKLSQLSEWVKRMEANPNPENPDPEVFFQVNIGTDIQDLIFQDAYSLIVKPLNPLYMEKASRDSDARPYRVGENAIRNWRQGDAKPTDALLPASGMVTGVGHSLFYAVQEGKEWVVRFGEWQGNRGHLVRGGYASKLDACKAIASRMKHSSPVTQAHWIQESKTVSGLFSMHTAELAPYYEEMKAAWERAPDPLEIPQGVPNFFPMKPRFTNYHLTYTQIRRLAFDTEEARANRRKK